MLPYWLLFALFAIGAMRSEGAVRPVGPATAPPHPDRAVSTALRRGGTLFTVASLLTAAMIGLRFKVGADWDTYLIIHAAIAGLGPVEAMRHWEPGFVLINYLADQLGTDIWLVNLISGAIFTYGLVQFARAQPEPWLAVLVGVPYLIIGVGMGYTRQAAAIGCCMAGFAALSRGSLLKMAAWVIAGAMFHRSAIVVLPLVMLSYSRNMFQMLLVAAIGGYVGYKLLSGSIDTYQQTYIRRVYESQGSGVRLAMNLPPAIIFLLISHRFNFSPKSAPCGGISRSLPFLASSFGWGRVRPPRWIAFRYIRSRFS